MGGAHTTEYITTKTDGSERFSQENCQHKYSKQPRWMFHGTIVNGQKGLACFWEKEWGNINSEKYDKYILSQVKTFCRQFPMFI